MEAIQTKFMAPSRGRGTRVKAWVEWSSLSLPYDHSLTAHENHVAAAIALCRQIGWSGSFIQGDLPSGGCAFVWTNDPPIEVKLVEVK